MNKFFFFALTVIFSSSAMAEKPIQLAISDKQLRIETCIQENYQRCIRTWCEKSSKISGERDCKQRCQTSFEKKCRKNSPASDNFQQVIEIN